MFLTIFKTINVELTSLLNGIIKKGIIGVKKRKKKQAKLTRLQPVLSVTFNLTT